MFMSIGEHMAFCSLSLALFLLLAQTKTEAALLCTCRQAFQHVACCLAGRPETVLVVFVGGVTFAEISALRFLAARPDASARFVICTTKILNGSSLLQTFVEPTVQRAAAQRAT
jgi:hypothetical protein